MVYTSSRRRRFAPGKHTPSCAARTVLTLPCATWEPEVSFVALSSVDPALLQVGDANHPVQPRGRRCRRPRERAT